MHFFKLLLFFIGSIYPLLANLTIVSSKEIKNANKEAAICQVNKLNDWSNMNTKILQTFNQNFETTFFALADNEIVGYAILDPKKTLLAYLAVHSDYQNQGIGTSLLERVYAQARELGFSYLSWYYRADKPEVEKFYKNFLDSHGISYKIHFENSNLKNKLISIKTSL